MRGKEDRTYEEIRKQNRIELGIIGYLERMPLERRLDFLERLTQSTTAEIERTQSGQKG